MSKEKGVIVQQEEEFDFDAFEEFEESMDEDGFIMSTELMLEHLKETTHHEMTIATELTKLVHVAPKDEETIMNTYRSILVKLQEESPIRQILAHLGCDENCED